MLAHLMTRLPVGDSAAYRVNLFSAVTSVLTLVFVYMTVHRLTKSNVGSLTAVLALGTATTFWAQATTANIRSLTALFAAMTIYWLIRFQEEQESETSQEELSPFASPAPLLFAVLSLSFGITHHASLVFMGVVFGIFVLIVDPTFIKKPQRWLRPFLLSLLSLLPLLYIPWRASLGAERAPARLATWTGFWNHVLARGFSGDFFYFIEPLDLWERLKIMGNVMTFQFTPLILVGMAVGLLMLLRHNWKAALLCGGSFLVHTVITATYRAPQTVEYMLPAYVPTAVCLGFGVAKMSAWRGVGRWTAVARAFITFFTLLLLVAPIWQGYRHFQNYRTLSSNPHQNDYAQLLRQAPPNSTILAHWHWVTPLWYLQEVDGIRADVAVQFVFPTSELYPETWARRVDEELANGRNVITTHYDASYYAHLPTPEPLGIGFLFRQQARTELPTHLHPFTLNLDNAIQIIGYNNAPDPIAIGEEMRFTVAWQTGENLCELSDCQRLPVVLFTHLVDAAGVIQAQADVPISASSGEVVLTQFHLTPRLGAVPGEYSLMVGAYVNTPAGIMPIGEPRTAVTSLTVTAMPKRPFTHNPTFYTSLVGYDWDNTLVGRPPRLYLHWRTAAGYVTEVRDVPEGSVAVPVSIWGVRRTITLQNQSTFYVPFGESIVWTGPLLAPDLSLRAGDEIILRQTFHSSRPILHDIATSVRLVGYAEGGCSWAWADLDDDFGIPAMGGIPTLKWVAGSTVHDPHQFTVPLTAVPHQRVGVILNLYDAFTNQPVPVLDERINSATPWREAVIETQ
jgi:hypothetical protein